MMKVKRKTNKTKPTVDEIDDLMTYADHYNKVFENVGHKVVGRVAELEAIKLAMLCGQHVMLEGQHGLAKSLLAEEVFCRISGATVFSKQFMKATQTEEVFGALDIKKYQNEAIMEHKTEGMLPEANFAFLDEVYRAADMVLPSMLQILNERRFKNGVQMMRCPLVSAVGTCNFTTNKPELEAFHDRWLVKVNVLPLMGREGRMAAYKGYLSVEEEDVVRIPFDVVMRLQKHAFGLPIGDTLLLKYDTLVLEYLKNLGSAQIYISDRRRCHALRLAQASATLAGVGFDDRVAFGGYHMQAVKYGLVTVGNEVQEAAFDTAFTQVFPSEDYSVAEAMTLDTLASRIEVIKQNCYNAMSQLKTKSDDATRNSVRQVLVEAVVTLRTDIVEEMGRLGVDENTSLNKLKEEALELAAMTERFVTGKLN